ncbi:MAG TPA: hypothetical protein VF062_13035 [Candidatus Limnocylindrales bacterium]
MVSKVLAVLFAVLTIPSVVGWWFQRDVLDTENYLEIVTPLASDPEVQSKLAEAVSEEIISRLDVTGKIEAAALELPPGAASVLSSLAVPLESGVDSYVQRVAADAVGSEGFVKVWVAVNLASHRQVVAGEPVYVDLGPIVEQTKARLVAEGFGLAATVPVVDERYALVTSPALQRAQRWYPLVKALPLLALVLLAVAMLISRSRLQILLIASMGTAIAMLVLTAATYIGRAIPAPPGGGAVYDAFTDSLRSDIRWVMAISAVIALGVWVLKRRLTPK